MEKMLNVEDAKRKLRVSDFSELREDQFKDYFSIMSRIEPSVNREILRVSPAFITLSMDKIEELIQDKIGTEGDYGKLPEILKRILDDIKPYRDKALLTPDEQNLVLEKMYVIATMLSEAEKEKSRSMMEMTGLITRTVLLIAGGLLSLAGLRKIMTSRGEKKEGHSEETVCSK